MKYNLDHVKSMYIGVVKDQEIVQCLNDLYPELQEILDFELEAGNVVQDASRDWPDQGSVFVTLKEPFHQKYALNSSVRYNEPNDPHYWHADYSCGKPLQILAY